LLAENRDPEFWRALADHPSCVHVKGGYDVDIGELIANPRNQAFSSQHGGWLALPLDGLSRVFDLHALYLPEGRGRAAFLDLLAVLGQIDFDLATVFETENPMSRPPKTVGFRPAGPARPSFLGSVRTWVLTRDAWEASPARRRL
jgi:hypothetical protein